MPWIPAVASPATVRVLSYIALMLFCVTFLRFVSLNFGPAPAHADAQTLAAADVHLAEAVHELERATRQLERTRWQQRRKRCGNSRYSTALRRAERKVAYARDRVHRLQRQQENAARLELRHRAAQPAEINAELRSRLGLEEAPQIRITH